MSASGRYLELEDGESDGEASAATERLGIDPRYEVVPEVDAEGNLGKFIDPFLDMTYPLNRENDLPEGVIRNHNRWQARHRPDGSGVVESPAGTATYGVRLPDETVVGNPWGGFWFPYKSDYHQRRDDDSGEVEVYDYDWFVQAPFRFIGEVLTMETDLDIGEDNSALRLGTAGETFVDGSAFMREVVGADILDDEDERGVLLTHDSGVQVYVGWDSTAHRGSEMFGFVPFDGDRGIPVPSASDALDLLRPNRAVGSDVDRQGEWFLAPTEEAAEGTIQKPGIGSKEWQYTAPRLGWFDTRHEAIGEVAKQFGGEWVDRVRHERRYPAGSPLDSHLPRDWRTVAPDDVFVRRFKRGFSDNIDVSDVETPQDAADLLAEHADEWEADYDVWQDFRDMAEGIHVRGTIRHRENEHEMVSADEWRRATTHDWDVITVDDSGLSRAAMYD